MTSIKELIIDQNTEIVLRKVTSIKELIIDQNTGIVLRRNTDK